MKSIKTFLPFLFKPFWKLIIAGPPFVFGWVEFVRDEFLNSDGLFKIIPWYWWVILSLIILLLLKCKQILQPLNRKEDEIMQPHQEGITRSNLTDVNCEMIANDTDKVIGIDVDGLTSMQNVNTKISVSNVKEATAIRARQAIAITTICSCGNSFSQFYTGNRPDSITCPHCGKSHLLK